MRNRRLLVTAASAVGLSVTLGAIALSVSACSLKGDKGDTGPAGASGTTTTPSTPFDITKINHLIVIYQENWSFDGLYSQFPGANGYRFNQPVTQLDANGNTLTTMPLPLDSTGTSHFTSSIYTGSSMPVMFYNLADFNAGSNPWASANTLTVDITHRYVHEQLQIDGGLNDKHLFFSDVSTGVAPGGANTNGICMSGVDAVAMQLPEEQLAESYTLCDNCFQSAFGGSFLNHQYLIAAQTPVYFNATSAAPAAISTPVDATKKASLWDAALTANPVPGSTTDYYAVNTIQPPFAPSGGGTMLPAQTNPTIATRLEAAGVSWKWYSEGWNTMNASTLGGTIGTIPTANPGALNFQYHHQPFNYFKAFDPSTPAGLAERAAHLKDTTDLTTDLANGTLPAVSFVKFAGDDNEHPGYSALLTGQQAVAALVKQVQASTSWKDCAIVITYDEFGGRYDHVKPPVVDAWGPGHRIPMIIVSPFSKFRYVDHTQYETDSILSFIEHRYSLTALSTHDAKANWFVNPFTTTPFANN
jgi:phospholipase C